MYTVDVMDINRGGGILRTASKETRYQGDASMGCEVSNCAARTRYVGARQQSYMIGYVYLPNS